MINYLATSSDSWQVILRRGILHYSYNATGEPLAGVDAYRAVIDPGGRLHIVITLRNERLIYARWQGRRWDSRELPVKGSVLSFSLDSHEQPHFLLRKSGYTEIIHLYLASSRWQQLVLPFAMLEPPLLFKPLSYGRLFLCSQDTQREGCPFLFTSYDPVKGWQVPRLTKNIENGYKNYLYGSKDYLFHLAWYPREGGYLVGLNCIKFEELAARSLSLGGTGEIPDDQPVLLIRNKTLLFLWTSSNRLAFCLSQDGGLTWSPPQSTYFFFPARIKAVEGPAGPSTGQAAFIKISGLELEWPLVVDFEPLFSLCKAVLVNPGDGEASWKQ